MEKVLRQLLRMGVTASVALALQACLPTTTTQRAPSSSASKVGGLPGLGGGILPSGSTLYAITLMNAGQSISSPNGQVLDLYGQNGEIAQYCPTVDDCTCRIRYTEPVAGGDLDIPVALDYVESDLARCSYSQVPSNVTQFSISITVNSGNLSSNEITLDFPSTDSTKDTSNAENYAKVTRFQCKDIFTTNSQWYQGLQDPQLWNLSISYNLYTTSLGRDYGGGKAVGGLDFECPITPTDETVVEYKQGRYWPDFSSFASSCYNSTPTIAGPLGLDMKCDSSAPSGTTANCPGATASFFGDVSTAGCGTTLQYNLRGSHFGAYDTTNLTSLESSSYDNVEDDEPYDMALYSSRPLTGYDNLIYPVDPDRGAPTSLGNPNGSSCTTGSDSSTCTCVTGREEGCRKYQINRHDFYVANFMDNTFRYPFCPNHTVGGSLNRNNILEPKDCSVDASQSPTVIGPDVQGFVALPNASGSCPNVDLPDGKKWGLLWKFRYQFSSRKLIDVVNPDEVGQLWCTNPYHECTNTRNSCNETNNNCNGAAVSNDPGDAAGPNYCSGRALGAAETFFIGALTADSRDGNRYGNCLDITQAAASGGTTGWCSRTDGSAPFKLGGARDIANAGYAAADDYFSTTGSSIRWEHTLANGQRGCYDPMQLYSQSSQWTWDGANLATGLLNTFTNSFTSANQCLSWNSQITLANFNSATGFDMVASGIADYNQATTFDWQGFPFIAGDYINIANGAAESQRGVGFGGNVCNPTLPGSRWSGVRDTGWTWNNDATILAETGAAATHQINNTSATVTANPGWQDGLDVWLVGNGSKQPCIEADVSANYNGSNATATGFLYNPYARTRDVNLGAPGSSGAGVSDANNFLFRLPGSNGTGGASDLGQGFVGLADNFPRTIKNWFDFIGVGCDGKCDNSDSSNSYPPIRDWIAGRSRQTGLLTLNGVVETFREVVEAAFRSGAHSDTTSWGGYGVYQFGIFDLESGSGREDIVYVVTPEGITTNDMDPSRNPDIYYQYRPIRYMRGIKLEYDVLNDSSNDPHNPDSRLPSFPVCVLQDDGTGQ